CEAKFREEEEPGASFSRDNPASGRCFWELFSRGRAHRGGAARQHPPHLCTPWPRGHSFSLPLPFPLLSSLSRRTNAERLRQSTYCSRHRDRSGTLSFPVCIPAHSITSQVWALEHVNARLLELYPDDEERFDIVLMTNNHAQVGVRLINSINHYGLTIERFCMTGGESPIGYLTAYLTNLYLSADSEKVQEAIEAGIASATMFTANKDVAYSDTQLRVAFDGDAVIFSDESEQIVKEHGLDRFFEHEQLNENKPLAQGPLKGFLEDLGKLQKKFYAKNERLNCPIRTYLVTARSAASSGARVLKTLRSWGLEIDEALFLAGAPKGPILVKIRPHIFFDDQMFHIEGAQKLGTIAAHVPYGVAQKYRKST
ncbi:PREDICTED: cytosolic 5'-nucleotidase 1B, partial [Corvus brachyrhynchos]|uniref:cytosolic 5'-nucleotidase 1B n=1 Tax=Corvus brachyrhynchos TaxID=85066 RepID=UPI0008163EBD